MFILYCDKCGGPIKSSECFNLLIVPPDSQLPQMENYDSINDYYKDYNTALNQINAHGKSICPNCMQLFHEFFKMRFQTMEEMAVECEKMFKIKGKEDEGEKS